MKDVVVLETFRGMPCILFDAVPTFHKAPPCLGDVDSWASEEEQMQILLGTTRRL